MGDDGLISDVVSGLIGDDGLLSQVLSPITGATEGAGGAGGLLGNLLGGLTGGGSGGLLGNLLGGAPHSAAVTPSGPIGDTTDHAQSIASPITSQASSGDASALSSLTDQLHHNLAV